MEYKLVGSPIWVERKYRIELTPLEYFELELDLFNRDECEFILLELSYEYGSGICEIHERVKNERHPNPLI